MKKILLLLFFPLSVSGQMGVNTNQPKTTLDVTGKATDPSAPDGVLPPRITKQQLTNKTPYTTSHAGTIVYVTDTAGTVNAATQNIKSVGHYAFDGQTWMKLNYDNKPGIASSGLNAGVNTLSPDGKEPKLLIIGIDAVRPDIMSQLSLPNIQSLISQGYYNNTSWLNGELSTVSGTGWSTLLYGVWPRYHSVANNTPTYGLGTGFKDILSMLEQVSQNYNTYAVYDWSFLTTVFKNPDLKVYIPYYNHDYAIGDAAVTEQAVGELKKGLIDAAFVYMVDADGVAHNTGSSSGTAYRSALTRIDKNIGDLLAALEQRPNYANEDWLIMICSDHGWNENNHYDITDLTKRSLYIVSKASGVAQGTTGVDGRQVDVAPTALYHMTKNLSLVNTFNLSGNVVGYNYDNPVTPVFDMPLTTDNTELIANTAIPYSGSAAVSGGALNLNGGSLKLNISTMPVLKSALRQGKITVSGNIFIPAGVSVTNGASLINFSEWTGNVTFGWGLGVHSTDKYEFWCKTTNPDKLVSKFTGPTTMRGGWHHLTVTYDGCVAKLYIDGGLTAFVYDSKNLDGELLYSDSYNYLSIGGFWDSNQDIPMPAGTRINKIKVFKGAMNQVQVTSLYNADHN